MIHRTLTSGVLAGVAAGLIAGLLYLVFGQPLLLEAELYETAALSHPGAAPQTPLRLAFEPGRDLLSLGFMAVLYAGYGLVLAGVMALATERGWSVVTARSGVLWGLCGFVALQLAPAFGLPPELPGAAVSEIGARQVWWFATVISTAIALGCLAFGRGPAVTAFAVILLLAPHLYGAPQAATFVSPAPPELAAHFAARSLAIGLAGWVLVGVFAARLWVRDAEG